MIVTDRRWARIEKPLKAAYVMGRLCAQGLMEPAECLPPLVAAAKEAAPEANASGRRMVLAHALRDSAAHWAMERARAARTIRRELEPLLASRAPSARLIAAAEAVNAEAGWPLMPREVRGAVQREVGFWLRKLEREAA